MRIAGEKVIQTETGSSRIDRRGFFKLLGGGEPAIMLVGAVIANAVFEATGVRFFRLPMTAERVRKGG